MIAVYGRGGPGLAQYIKAITQCAGGRHISVSPLNPILSQWEEREEMTPEVIPYEYQWLPTEYHSVQRPQNLTNYALSQTLFTKKLTVGTGISGISHLNKEWLKTNSSVGTQLRYLHNDIKIPNFDDYRRDNTKDPTKVSRETRDQRRLLPDMVKVGTGVMGAIVGKKIGQTLVANWMPAPSTLAFSVIEVNLAVIPEGKNVTIKWNNKPVFVRHRTQAEIDREKAVDITQLRDPQTDEERSPTGKWLVVMANCTHLGCVPISHQGNWGGYFCPCHGSHYDASGRIRKGPAPLNLEVPDHYIDGDKLILGAKEGADN